MAFGWKRATALLGAISGILLITVVVTDWPLGLMSNFWAAHSMLTNVASSLLFLLFGATIVEAWLSREDSRRFRVIQAAAFSSLSNSPLTQRRALWFLVNGGKIMGNADFRVSQEEVERLDSIFRPHGFEEASEDDVRLGRLAIPDDVRRLKILVADRDWLELAYEVCLRSLYNSRLIISRWAHLLITSERASVALEQLALVILDLQELRKLMLSLLSRDDDSLNNSDSERFCKLWRKCFVNSCAAYGDLAQSGMSAELADWDSGMLLLQSDDRAVIQAIVAGRRDKRRFPIGRVYSPNNLPQLVFGGEGCQGAPAGKDA
jgi:hypothetical protein